MWYKLQIPAHRKLTKEDHEFKASPVWPQTHYIVKMTLNFWFSCPQYWPYS